MHTQLMLIMVARHVKKGILLLINLFHLRQYMVMRIKLQLLWEASFQLKKAAYQKQKSPGSSTTPDKRGCLEPPNKTNKTKLDKVNEVPNALPTYESHYCRKESSNKYIPPHLTISELHKKYCEVKDKPVSYTIFSKLFSGAYIAIKNPKKDTCRTRDELKMNSLYAAKLAYQVKIAYKNLSKTDNSMTVLAFDLQQCLPTTSLQTSVAFYERQLGTFNLTAHDMKDDQATCFLWHKLMARRGAIEIASCVRRAILNLPEEIKHVVLYSDSCPGQNKNTPFLAMCLYVVQEKKIDMLDHKLMAPGHSRKECDSDHDWAQMIRMAGNKKPFNVTELTQENV
ncbi:hypothetical protein PR048_018407 [Dryococelus australis]|uniref:Uncharacterized protein n=1 Tax=Dryococelus australis TaxID=614101 RepID=A0ABQ9HCA8_9NEOP|nr:hypothetical protein PR048_018407 [Dryococelus australis]